MRLLLDTHAFLRKVPWHLSVPPTLTHNAARVASLPFPANGHRDPFDRLLIAQCLVEGLTLVTADVKLAEYGVTVLW
jgi:PIN domain nuclease of toxin-antitoxin system